MAPHIITEWSKAFYTTNKTVESVILSLIYANISIMNTSYAKNILNKTEQQYLPTSFYVNETTCLSYIKQYNGSMSVLFQQLNTMLPRYRTQVSNLETDNLLINPFYTEQEGVFGAQDEVIECMKTYVNAMNDILKWNTSATLNNLFYSGPTDWYTFSEAVKSIIKDKDQIKTNFAKYKLDQITKMALYQSFLKADDLDVAFTNVNNFVTDIGTKLITQLQNKLQDAKSTFQELYKDMLTKAVNIYPHLDKAYFRKIAQRLILFKGPQPNLKNPKAYLSKQTDIYSIWNVDQSFPTFVNSLSSVQVKQALDEYFEPLISIINNFANLLQSSQATLKAAITTVQNGYTNYLPQTAIGAQFIQ